MVSADFAKVQRKFHVRIYARLNFQPFCAPKFSNQLEIEPSFMLTLLTGGQKIAQVYKQNFTGRITLQPGTT